MRTGRAALAAIGMAATLGGCASTGGPSTDPQTATYRAYQLAFSAQPFAAGPISIVAHEDVGISTFSLAPCGQTVCEATSMGRAGTVERTLDYMIVRGLYGGRTFWLSPGGDGAIHYANGVAVPLAWE